MFFEQLRQMVQTAILGAADGILRFLQIPHLRQADSIELVGTSLELEITWLSLFGWPTFVSLALIYSLIQRRGIVLTVLNLVSVSIWWFIFQTGVLVTVAVLHDRGWDVTLLVIQLCLLLVTALMFLSSERGLRGLLAPVADGAGDSRQANPLIVLWNRLFASRLGQEKS